MNMVRWSPFREFDNMLTALEGPATPVRRADWLPLVDIRENGSEYQIDVEVPAVAAADLSVTVADGVLTVSGERKNVEPAQDSDERVRRIERRYGKFVRNFQLPEDADYDAIDAEARDGVLYLKVAKRASATPKEIEVKIS